jgi:hypothetical protein
MKRIFVTPVQCNKKVSETETFKMTLESPEQGSRENKFGRDASIYECFTNDMSLAHALTHGAKIKYI